MMDIKFIRKNKKLIEKNILARGIDIANLNCLLSLTEKRNHLLTQIESNNKIKSLLNNKIEIQVTNTKAIPEDLIDNVKAIKGAINKQESEIQILQSKINTLLNAIPNILHPSVPKGLPGKPNKLIKKSLKKKQIDV